MEKKVMDQERMRESNLMEVFALIRSRGSVTRRELQSLAGLSWGGTSQIVSRLLKQGFIEEEKDVPGQIGRRPSLLKVNEKKNFIIGVDINEAGITAVRMNLCGAVLERRQGEADYADRKSLLKSVYQVLDRICSQEEPPFAIGVSMQGVVDAKRGISVSLEGCGDWSNVSVCRLLGERYHAPVYAAHDPDCLVASNVSSFGEDVMLFRADYGIGMSVYRDGAFFTGPGLLEVGHTLAVPPGKGEEKRRTLAYYATVPEIEKRAGTNIPELIRTGRAEVYFEEAADCLAAALVNSALMFNIRTILLSGRLMDYEEFFFDRLKAKVREYFGGEIRIFSYDVGKAAFGAALLAAERRMDITEVKNTGMEQQEEQDNGNDESSCD